MANNKYEWISARVEHAINNKGEHFICTRISNVQCVRDEPIEGHVERYREEDYTFDYEGESYRINRYIMPTAEGVKIYSAEYFCILIRPTDNYSEEDIEEMKKQAISLYHSDREEYHERYNYHKRSNYYK